MKISSYNITDVGYHYIGLRVLAGLPSNIGREQQTKAISRSVLKYVHDKALRLMLPEPKGTFETVGEKIAYELVHFQFAVSKQRAFELTDLGRSVLELLDNKKHRELRRLIATVHLQTYDNLRLIVQRHLELRSIWRPFVETGRVPDEAYLAELLEPTFKEDSSTIASDILDHVESKTPKKLEDALHERILRRIFPNESMSVPLFRAICDRLVSLRLLNIMKSNIKDNEFAKSYSPCMSSSPPSDWYVPLKINLSNGGIYNIYFCEPDMRNQENQQKLLSAIDEAFAHLNSDAGYYDLPDVRDSVCEALLIPEAAFDEGVNFLLDLRPQPLTVGLTYEGISGRRKPLIRTRETTQIYNLMRRN